METWSNNISKNIEDDINNLKNYDEKEKYNIINGRNFQKLKRWCPLQSLLLWDIDFHKYVILLLENGANPNLRSASGFNFFQLYIILMYTHPSFRTIENVRNFVRFITISFHNNNVFFYKKKFYYLLDFLYLLQNKKINNILIKNKFTVDKNLEYIVLDDEIYDEMILLFLCLGCKYKKLKHRYTDLKIYDIKFLLNKKFCISSENFFKKYIIEMYKIPDSLSNADIMKRIYFLVKNIDLKFINEKLYDIYKDKPMTSTENDADFFNPMFVENSQLQRYEFFTEPLVYKNKKHFFHKTFFYDLFSKQTDIYTRQNIDKNLLKKYLSFMNNNFMFPIQTLDDTLKISPYIFNNFENIKYDIFLLEYINEFIKLYNPYNQFDSIRKLKGFELRYISHYLYYESDLFKRFESQISSPNLEKILLLILYFCLNNKSNIIGYFIEECLQDIKSYKKVKHIIHNLENAENSNIFYNEYLFRYTDFHPVYIAKFIENMLSLNTFEIKK